MSNVVTTGSAAPRVAYLGPAGAFTHQAALSFFGAGAAQVDCASIPSVFDAVGREQADFGVVPIENSIEGGVSFTLDTLLDTSLLLCGEVIENIEQCLLSDAPEPYRVRRVYSHPQGLAQCRRWLNQHLPDAALVSTLSTSLAAHQVKGDPEAAAIASELAGALAGVKLVARGIQDRKSNATRFVVLGRQEPAPSGRDKTSLVFTTKDERGALCRALSIFDREGINLSRIESRPRESEEAWQYVFFTDLEGHRRDAPVQRALAELQRVSDMVKVFGSYPRAGAR